MSYKVNGTNMLQWFYSDLSASNIPNKALTTNFKINNVDISNNYVGIGTNSNIPVSQLYTIPYNSAGQSIGTKFELNLPDFSGNINVDYKIWDPSNNGGLLIQILKSTTLKFNYDVDCSFVIVGGGGGGGSWANDGNAGGGGGAGEVITGSIIGYKADMSLNISIGNGGTAGVSGSNTTLNYTTDASSITITANGGGFGGFGKGSSINVTGSSSGGTGSYSASTFPFDPAPSVGTATQRTLPDTSIFTSMTSFNNVGSLGNDQSNDSGGGGGGGGSNAPAVKLNNEDPVAGGSGNTITYGSTNIPLGGGGGGGSRGGSTGTSPNGALGGLGGGGNGGGKTSTPQTSGYPGTANTGGGGGGASNDGGTGGLGGSGTVFFYIIPSGVTNP